MEIDTITISEWIDIYEHLDGDGHLSKDGQIELASMKLSEKN